MAANAAIQPKPIQLAAVKAYRDRWETPHEKDPFAVPIEEKMPAPITAPIASRMRSPAPSTRLSACGLLRWISVDRPIAAAVAK